MSSLDLGSIRTVTSHRMLANNGLVDPPARESVG